MKPLSILAGLGLLALSFEAKAQTDVPASLPKMTDPAASAPLQPDPIFAPDESFNGNRFWADADMLSWWMRGTSLPPLVTTSPAGTPIEQAGVPGTNGAVVLFGNSIVNDDARIGARFTAGWWFDDDHTCGIEGSFFVLEDKAAGFLASSTGNPILSRPFFDANSGAPSAQRVAFPGDVTGAVGVADTASGLLGIEVLLRERVCEGCNSTLDVLFGYRYLTFSDNLTINENLTSTNPNNPNFIPAGTNILIVDRFGAKNEFNGLDWGLTWEYRTSRWDAIITGKVAAGYNRQTVDIVGGTANVFPPAAPAIFQGGLLAQTSNSGHFGRDEISVVPELDLKVRYHVTNSLALSLGYTYLYWSNVVRAANQVDLTVNPNLIPPALNAATGPNRPAFEFQRTSLWAQGVSLGLEFRY